MLFIPPDVERRILVVFDILVFPLQIIGDSVHKVFCGYHRYIASNAYLCIYFEDVRDRRSKLFDRIHFNEIGSSSWTVYINVTFPVYEIYVR